MLVTKPGLGSQYSPFALAAALDQDVIIDKFDSIFAAMSSVHLEDI
ncbi:MAG TPA: hypothetical protein VFO10_15440 [Oligoflexus sp.]|nr:hypothetical protein [Oligoflexus sp.]HET9238654.1 hypothetical protein [Oligoflexus sp.]